MGGGEILLTPTASATASHHHLLHQQPPTSSTKNPNFLYSQEKETSGYCSENMFGLVPTQTEVQKAILDLQKVMNGFHATSLEMNELGQVIFLDDSKMTGKSLGQKRILDAYHMLQTDPSIERMVISISSDRAVWDAILQNNAVQDLRGSLLPAGTTTGVKTMGYQHEDDLASFIVKWIFGTTKSKIIAFIEKFGSLVNELFQPAAAKEKPMSKLDDLLEEKVRSSLLLSIVILLIVVVTRGNNGI